jgi:hypothetical protein
MMHLVMHMKGRQPKGSKATETGKSETAAITVRLPRADYEALRKLADTRGVSLSFLAAEALTKYELGHKRRQLFEEINAFREELKDRHGVGEDSVALVRRMRLERVAQRCGEDTPEEGPNES